MVRSIRSIDYDDPLTLAILPPLDETPQQRAVRERAEGEAKRINDEIDEMIRQERVALRRSNRRKPVKVLLLGQSESGKSTTLKNFQLTYAPLAWTQERAAWRAVIQLNLVRSVTLILDLLTAEMTTQSSPSSPSSPLSTSPYGTMSTLGGAGPGPSSLASRAGGSSSAPIPIPSPMTPAAVLYDEDDDDGLIPGISSSPPAERGTMQMLPPLGFTEHHRVLKLRLGPLRRVQKDLERRLGSGAEEPVDMGVRFEAAPFENTYGIDINGGIDTVTLAPRRPQEFYVHSRTGWKSALEKLSIVGRHSTSSDGKDSSSVKLAKEKRAREADESTAIIAGLAEDMELLWNDPVIREMLSRKRVRLEDKGGFFLNDIVRVATREFEPSDDDVMRARLRTVGVQEYRFMFEKGAETGHEWLMYDVGGTRTLRQVWSSYFDDMNAIIFLAPISCFDEKLAEDRRVNRLEDSFLLWKAVVSNKILARTQLVLFLNKCDLLDKKLKSGIRVRDYVPSFGDRKNEVSVVAKYLRQKFKDITKQFSPEQRPFYAHMTTAIDTKATAITLGAVREGILRDHLRGADFI